jgi:Copper transport outer membrane protein, MctB
MIDYRYHALSLAAVLFALALGVLLGVAIGDSNLVSSAKSGVVHNLEGEVAGARRRAAQLQQRLSQEREYASELLPLSVHGLLQGRTVGLVFLGASSDRIDAMVRGAVGQAGGTVTTVAAVREPLDLAGIAGSASGTRYAALGGTAALAGFTPLVYRFGELSGRELVSGGPQVERSLLSRVRASLLSAFDGRLERLEGLVVVRAEPGGMSRAQAEAAAAYESGLLAGVASEGVPAVGVELTGSSPSQVGWYKSRGISSVDDLEAPAGQVAVVFALAGDHGAFGAKPSADALLPPASRAPARP